VPNAAPAAPVAAPLRALVPALAAPPRGRERSLSPSREPSPSRMLQLSPLVEPARSRSQSPMPFSLVNARPAVASGSGQSGGEPGRAAAAESASPLVKDSSKACAENAEGSVLFKDGAFAAALERFSAAIRLDHAPHRLAGYLSNRAACYLRLVCSLALSVVKHHNYTGGCEWSVG